MNVFVIYSCYIKINEDIDILKYNINKLLSYSEKILIIYSKNDNIKNKIFKNNKLIFFEVNRKVSYIERYKIGINMNHSNDYDILLTNDNIIFLNNTSIFFTLENILNNCELYTLLKEEDKYIKSDFLIISKNYKNIFQTEVKNINNEKELSDLIRKKNYKFYKKNNNEYNLNYILNKQNFILDKCFFKNINYNNLINDYNNNIYKYLQNIDDNNIVKVLKLNNTFNKNNIKDFILNILYIKLTDKNIINHIML